MSGAPYDRRASDEPRVPEATEARAMTPPVTRRRPKPGLSPRMLQCLAAYVEEANWNEVGYRLGLSGRTVDVYVGMAYSRLDARNVIDAYRILGWLRVPDGVPA